MAASSAYYLSIVSFDYSRFCVVDNREKASEGIESIQHLQSNLVVH